MTTPFGERLRDYRKARGMSQGELAAQLGVALNMISKVEHGVRKVSFEEAVQLADALQVSLNDLAGITTETAGGIPPGELSQYQLFKLFCQEFEHVHGRHLSKSESKQSSLSHNSSAFRANDLSFVPQMQYA